MNQENQSHRQWMKRALELARRAKGMTSPNPLVGAVVVKKGRILGEGYHIFQKLHHAEALALELAGTEANGGDLYVTLEPCHHQGRTPPCVDRILKSGIRRVFVATRDPNPKVRGGGVEALREKGIEVTCGICEQEASELNEVFFHFVRKQIPFITLKLALSLDGKVAAKDGASKWITGEKARKFVHFTRFLNDGILIGINTLLKDNPSLDVRWRRKNSIRKIILDSDLRTPLNARLFDSGDPVLIFHGNSPKSGKGKRFPEHVQLLEVKRTEEGLDWVQVAKSLGEQMIQSLLVEGGGLVAGTLVKSKLVNRFLLFYGPKIIGSDGRPSFCLQGVSGLSDAVQVALSKIRRFGDDFLVEANPLFGNSQD